MKRARLFGLIEDYLGGAQSPDERRELEAAVQADADVRAAFVEQVRLARCLRAGLRRRQPEELWRKLEPLLAAHEDQRRHRTADAVDARINEQQRAARARRRRRVGIGLALALSLGGAAMALTLRARWRGVAGPGGDEGAPALVDMDTADGAAPPSARTAPGPRLRPRVIGKSSAAEQPGLVAPRDILIYETFDGETSYDGSARGWLQPSAALAPGFFGKGLEVRYFAGGGPVEPGARFVIGVAAGSQPPSGPPDEVFLRYYVRLSDNFDFGPGGVLPGVCGGRCGAPPRSLDGVEAWAIRLRWSPTGELGFEHVPHAQLALGWNRTLTPGRWHALELRVKLNDPARADGVIEGWFDGEKVATHAGLRLRSVGTLHADGVAFDTFFRGRGQGPSREVRAIFDELVLATSYVGPRADK
jgi:hypothetical protein